MDTRKREVVVVTSDLEKPIILSEDQMAQNVEIEELIVACLVEMHLKFCDKRSM